jgi:hypothetical protein
VNGGRAVNSNEKFTGGGAEDSRRKFVVSSTNFGGFAGGFYRVTKFFI